MNEQLTVRLTEEQCWAALRTVIDPEIYQNIVDLGLVYGVEADAANAVTVTMTLTTPHCPMGPQILESVENALRAAGATGVETQVVWDPMWTPEMMTESLKRQLGILDEEEPEPELVSELPPPPPKKKSFWQRLLS